MQDQSSNHSETEKLQALVAQLNDFRDALTALSLHLKDSLVENPSTAAAQMKDQVRLLLESLSKRQG